MLQNSEKIQLTWSRNPVTDLRCRGAISELFFIPQGVEKRDILQKVKSLLSVMLIFKSAANQSAEWEKKKKKSPVCDEI